jgi:ATP-dependent 26S proteasome regulatory subunit
VIATTNFITNFLENLTNRPGRFDDKIEIKAPSPEARAKFLEFFSNSEATQEDLAEISQKEYNEFSIAHVKEAFIRSRIYGITLVDSIRQISKEIQLYKKAFQDKIKRMGMGEMYD